MTLVPLARVKVSFCKEIASKREQPARWKEAAEQLRYRSQPGDQSARPNRVQCNLVAKPFNLSGKSGKLFF